jgi:hypothetical protein
MKLFKTLSLVMLALPGALLARDFRDYQDLAKPGQSKRQILDALNEVHGTDSEGVDITDANNVAIVEMLFHSLMDGQILGMATMDGSYESLIQKDMKFKKMKLKQWLASDPDLISAKVAPSSSGAATGTSVASGDIQKKAKAFVMSLGLDERMSSEALSEAKIKIIDKVAELMAEVARLQSKVSSSATASTATAAMLSAASRPAGNAALLAGIQSGVGLKKVTTVVKDGSDGSAAGAPVTTKEFDDLTIAELEQELTREKQKEPMNARQINKIEVRLRFLKRQVDLSAGTAGSASPVSTGSSSGSSSPTSVPAFGLPNRPGNKPVGSPVVAPVVSIADEAAKFGAQWSTAKNAIAKAQLIRTLPDEYATASPVNQAKISYILGLNESLIPSSVKDKVDAWRT